MSWIDSRSWLDWEDWVHTQNSNNLLKVKIMKKPLYFDNFGEAAFARGGHSLATNTIKVMFTNTEPTKDLIHDTAITQISSSGYTAGGYAVTLRYASQQNGKFAYSIKDLTVTASGGEIGPFRWAVIYNDSNASESLICFYDLEEEVTINDTKSIKLDFSENLFEFDTSE